LQHTLPEAIIAFRETEKQEEIACDVVSLRVTATPAAAPEPSRKLVSESLQRSISEYDAIRMHSRLPWLEPAMALSPEEMRNYIKCIRKSSL
jgi:transposase